MRTLEARAWIGALVLAAAAAAAAPTADDPFRDLLFPPELVLAHQQTIGFTGEQRAALVAEVTRAQSDFVPLQAELAARAERLRLLLAEPRVDEEAALVAAAEVMALESDVKRRHLKLAVRIKNLLSPEQQARLRDMRRD